MVSAWQGYIRQVTRNKKFFLLRERADECSSHIFDIFAAVVVVCHLVSVVMVIAMVKWVAMLFC